MSTGYLNRVIHLPFPDLGGLTEKGNAVVWVMIRNPRLLPAQELLNTATVAIGDDGKPVDQAAAQRQTFSMMASLIVAGNVFDPTWVPEIDGDGSVVNPDEPQPLLSIPMDAEAVGKLPLPILNAIGEELKKINPQ